MRCMGVLKLQHVDISAPDLELAAAYYTQVLGLDLVAQLGEAFTHYSAGDHGRHGRESRAPTAGIPPDEPGHRRQSSETVTVTSMLPLVALE